MQKKIQIYSSFNEKDTRYFAAGFARRLMRGDVVLLSGDLGMGKSVFCRAVVRSLCKDDDMEVPSPTFSLVQHYESADGIPVHHFDLYRLDAPDEIFELGWDDALSDGITLVEWPERLGGNVPDDAFLVFFDAGEKEYERVIGVYRKGNA